MEEKETIDTVIKNDNGTIIKVDNGYIIIPMPLLKEKELTSNEKIMCSLIKKLSEQDGYCFAGNKHLSDKVNISEVNISKTLKKIEKKGYIKIEYIRDGSVIKNRKIYITERLSKLITVAIIEIDKDNNKAIKGIINNKKEIYKEKVFIKPTYDEVNKYCVERKNGIDANRFIDHYTSVGWKVGKNPMKDWKACVRTWEGRRKEERQNSGQALKESPVPNWVGNEIVKQEMSKEEEQELKSMLEEFK